MKHFSKNDIGTLVRWKDPNDGLCSGIYRIVGIGNECVQLGLMISDLVVAEALDEELETFSEETQVEIFIAHFNSREYKNGDYN